jgi:WXG100 family type VII secretion target
MSASIIKMNYADMEQMASIFQTSAQKIEEMIQEMKSVASLAEGGALQGKGGQAFEEAINNKLNKSLERLRLKLLEEAQDIRGAQDFMEKGDTTAQSRFK